MKIHYVGTGNVFSKRLSPCIVIDQKILIEIPNGATKALMNVGEEIQNISLCLISHMHADHVFDVPFLILNKYRTGGEKMIIVGPQGMSNRIDEICKTAYPTLDWKKICYQTIECVKEVSSNKENMELQGYIISAVKVRHSEELCYGYYIEDDKQKSFCYTGDTVYCDGVEKLIKNAQVCCVEMNEFTGSETHMGYEDIEKLCSGNRKIYAVHTPDEVKKRIDMHIPINFPTDDTLIET